MLDRERQCAGKTHIQGSCCYCRRIASFKLHPCGHLLCEDCDSGMDSRTICPEPSCTVEVTRRKRIAAPTSAPGQEDDLDGIKELSMDEKIIRLEMCAKRGLVGSFKPKVSAVSPLCGARGDVE